MSKVYGSISDYLKGITIADSNILGWKSIRLSLVADSSNSVKICRLRRNTIKLMLSGTSRHRVRIAGAEFAGPTKAGEVILFPAGSRVELSWVVLGDIEQSVIVEFDDDFFQIHCPDISADRLRSDHVAIAGYSEKTEIAMLIKMLARELDEAARRGPRFAEATIRLLAMEVANADWYPAQIGAVGKMNVRSRVVQSVRLIDHNFASNLSITNLADAAGLSRSRFISLFKDQTGRTPHAYLIDRRIQRAAVLLCETSQPIADIAIDCGFLDQSQMTRLLRARLGTTPRTLRMKAKLENSQ